MTCDRCHIDAGDCQCPEGVLMLLSPEQWDWFTKWLDEPDDPDHIERIRAAYRHVRENSQIEI